LGVTPVVCPPGTAADSFTVTDLAYDGDGYVVSVHIPNSFLTFS
jgi:YD repeat-containing protein